MAQALDTIFERFKSNVVKWLNFVADSIDDLNDLKLTTFKSDDIALAISMLNALYDESPEMVMYHFINGHMHWEMIAKRDLKFVTEEIPKIYGKTAIDVDAITEIPKVYLKLKKSGYKGNKDEDSWPVNNEDMEQQWKFFNAMTIWACRFIKHRRSLPDIKQNEDIDKTIKKIDLEKYEKLFDVKYDY